jgi:hypothetical protein
MKTKDKKEFDAVRFIRDQRKLISEKLCGMTKAEILAYFKKKQEEGGVRPSAE